MGYNVAAINKQPTRPPLMNDYLEQYIEAHGCTLLAYNEESGMMLIGTMEHIGFCATEMVASLTSFRNFIGY